ELAYIHAEGFAAGELKHGPIALIEPGQAVFVIVPTPRRPTLHNKVVSNIQEIRARGARTLVIAEEGDDSVDEFAEVVFRVPRTPTLMMPLVTVVPLQIFACALAGAKGLDVDQPRNLAKSVTVEQAWPHDRRGRDRCGGGAALPGHPRAGAGSAHPAVHRTRTGPAAGLPGRSVRRQGSDCQGPGRPGRVALAGRHSAARGR